MPHDYVITIGRYSKFRFAPAIALQQRGVGFFLYRTEAGESRQIDISSINPINITFAALPQ